MVDHSSWTTFVSGSILEFEYLENGAKSRIEFWRRGDIKHRYTFGMSSMDAPVFAVRAEHDVSFMIVPANSERLRRTAVKARDIGWTAWKR